MSAVEGIPQPTPARYRRVTVSSFRVAEPGQAESRRFRSPAEAALLLMAYYRQHDEDREQFLALYLSTKNSLVGMQVVTAGSVDQALVHPREVFRGALLLPCRSVVIAHNHPSGDVEPSGSDVELTRQMVRAGEVLGIPLVDHIIVGIVGHGRYYSFAEERKMPS